MQTAQTQSNTEVLSAAATSPSLHEGRYALECGGLARPAARAPGVPLLMVQVLAPPLRGDGQIIGAPGKVRAWLGPDGDTVVVKAPLGGGQLLVTAYGLPESVQAPPPVEVRRSDRPLSNGAMCE